jgi:nitric oxide reductase NorD protein
MADAEDVLLSAAAHAGSLTRALRARPCKDAGAVRVAAAERRVAAWLAALDLPPLEPTAWPTPPPASWLVRALGLAAPWQRRPRAIAWSDGRQLFLPNDQLRSEDPESALRVLLAALAQGQRIARGRLPDAGGSALARDVRFALEAALGDAEIAALLPGLAAALDAARARTRAARPARARLRPAERVVESLVCALLTGPARDAAARVAEQGVPIQTPADATRIAYYWAQHLAALPGGYRGVAPVEHWGVPAPTPALGVRHAAPRPDTSSSRQRRPPSRSIARPLLRRTPDEDEGSARPGPFVLPHGEPHLAVQDARGLARPHDAGEEDLDALADELARAGELPTVRSPGGVREILASGTRPTGAATSADPQDLPGSDAAAAFLYPEWDAGRNAYRNPGVVVRERTLTAAGAVHAQDDASALRARLRRQFEALRPRRERIGRRLDGDDIDVDGIVAEHGDRSARCTPEGRVYTREQRRRRDVAVALLIDASGSTDAWVARNTRVIDVARRAALCLGEALTALGDHHAILAFSGRGPADVRVGVAKRFAEPWSAAVRARLAALEPDRSTRLGGAIRHVTAQLLRQPARARLLLLLSDGKPDDDDAYEGTYGLEDVRQAVFEARRAGVRPFCVTIDRSGPAYLPRLFGPHGYTVLCDVAQLPERLPPIYRRLAGV